jgi:hypothetical protein
MSGNTPNTDTEWQLSVPKPFQFTKMEEVSRRSSTLQSLVTNRRSSKEAWFNPLTVAHNTDSSSHELRQHTHPGAEPGTGVNLQALSMEPSGWRSALPTKPTYAWTHRLIHANMYHQQIQTNIAYNVSYLSANAHCRPYTTNRGISNRLIPLSET